MVIIIPECKCYVIKSFEDHNRQGWNKVEAREAHGLGAKFKGTPKYLVMKIQKYSMQYFFKSILMQEDP